MDTILRLNTYVYDHSLTPFPLRMEFSYCLFHSAATHVLLSHLQDDQPSYSSIGKEPTPSPASPQLEQVSSPFYLLPIHFQRQHSQNEVPLHDRPPSATLAPLLILTPRRPTSKLSTCSQACFKAPHIALPHLYIESRSRFVHALFLTARATNNIPLLLRTPRGLSLSNESAALLICPATPPLPVTQL